MLTREKFAADVEAHLKATGIPPTQLGWRALRDPNFVFDLRKGRSPNLDIVCRVYAFMEKNRAPKRRAAA